MMSNSAAQQDRATARWNHNIHYHSLLIDAASTAQRVLDVGCGEGMLTRQLALRAREVIGIDLDAPSIDLARATTPANNVEYLCADVLQHPFEPASFDAVVSVATLHHLGTTAGLLRLRELVRPGGVLGVVGLAAGEMPWDLPRELAAAIGTRVLKLTRNYWEHAAPKQWHNPDSYTEVRRIAEALLPGVQYRRHLLWRYSLLWRRAE